MDGFAILYYHIFISRGVKTTLINQKPEYV